MLRSPHSQKLFVGLAGCFDIEFGSDGELIYFSGHAQALQFEYGVNRHEHMIVLCRDSAGRRLRQRRVGLQRFMKHFHFPPFFVERGNSVAVTR